MARFGRACVWQSENTGFGTFGCWRCVSYYRDSRTAPRLTPDTGISGPAFGERRHHTTGPLKAKLAVAPWSRSAVKVFCPVGHGETPGQQVLLGRSGSLVPWLLPKEVRRFDLGSPPNRQSWRLLPCRLPHRAAGQKTARILDMNGGKPLFFKVRKRGEDFSLQYLEVAEGVCGGTSKNFFVKF